MFRYRYWYCCWGSDCSAGECPGAQSLLIVRSPNQVVVASVPPGEVSSARTWYSQGLFGDHSFGSGMSTTALPALSGTVAVATTRPTLGSAGRGRFSPSWAAPG